MIQSREESKREKRCMLSTRCVCVLYPELEKFMNMQKAQRYMQVTCLTHITAVNNCMIYFFSSSPLGRREWGREGEESHGDILFSQRGWNTNTLMKQTHGKKAQNHHTQVETRWFKYALPTPPPHTHTRIHIHTHTQVNPPDKTTSTFSFQSVFQGNILPSLPPHLVYC